MGHNCVGHNYVGPQPVGHNYLGHTYLDHNYIVHNYIVDKYVLCAIGGRLGRQTNPCATPTPTRSLAALSSCLDHLCRPLHFPASNYAAAAEYVLSYRHYVVIALYS